MKLMRPEVGGPYRKIPTFEQMIDVPKKKIPDIDRSGLVAIDSYELGYLRDSLGEMYNIRSSRACRARHASCVQTLMLSS